MICLCFAVIQSNQVTLLQLEVVGCLLESAVLGAHEFSLVFRAESLDQLGISEICSIVAVDTGRCFA